ncbi:fungal-specific transcription factor domain-containing protein [Mycena vitilis]|nr:fungal-specific transcription factor domain-containing protein [Mycena vitilis]
MSSEDDQPGALPSPAKKRRVQRACDMCRRRKKACDGIRVSGKKCKNCGENGLECTFAGPETKRQSYVEALEARLETTERLQRMASTQNQDIRWSSDSPVLQHGERAATPTGSSDLGPGVLIAGLNLRNMSIPAPDPEGDDMAHIALQEQFHNLSLTYRFQGKRSCSAHARLCLPRAGPPRVACGALLHTHTNLYFPVLHRPTFARALASNLHARDPAFASVVLLVCAIGARFSPDPRVAGEEPLRCGWEFFDQLPGHPDFILERPSVYHLQYYCLAATFLESSAPAACWMLIGFGLRLAQDLGVHRQSAKEMSVEGELWKRGFWLLYPHSIDVDFPIECDEEYWPGEAGVDSPESSASCSDHTTPASTTEDSPEKQKTRKAWLQPLGIPSRLAFFNCFLRLNNILGFGLKMLYALKKTKVLLAHRDAQWEEHLVAEMDSALNGWVDSIPSHLRCDPARQDDALFAQSVLLYCTYYQVQIAIHRPFIPMMRGNGRETVGLSFFFPVLPNLRDSGFDAPHFYLPCESAPLGPALIGNLYERGTLLQPHCRCVEDTKGGGTGPCAYLFTSGMILLLNVWSGKRTGLPPHLNSAIAEVHKCMKIIGVCEKRVLSQTAGVFYDLLHELATIALPKEPARPSAPSPSAGRQQQKQKRAREEDELGQYGTAMPVQHPPYANAFHSPLFTGPVPVALNQQFAPSLGLPVYGDDLGRLPVFHQNAVGFPDFAAELEGETDAATGFENFGADELGIFGDALDLDVNSFSLGAGADGIGSDIMAMWASAPTGFEVEDWGTYFDAMNQMSGNGDGFPGAEGPGSGLGSGQQ